MFRKLFLACLALLVFSLAVFGAITARSTRRRMLEEFELRLDAEAAMLAAIVRAGAAEGALGNLGKRRDSRLTVIRADGTVLADSHADAREMDNHNDRPEVRQARATGRGVNVRHSETVGYDMMYCAAAVETGGQGTVARVALPLTRIEEEVGAVYRGMAIAFVLIGLAGAGLLFLITRRLTRPLLQIQSVADSIASGDLAQKASFESKDEVGRVAAAINRMIDELSSRLDSLRTETARLEAVIAGMEEGVVAVDRRGRVLHLNGAARRMFGIWGDPRGLALGEAIRAVGIEQQLKKVLGTGEPVRTSLEIGSRIAAVYIGAVGGTEGAVLVAHDATEERRYDALRKEFVANVSHELRTPLSLIQGFVETLKEGAWKDADRAPEFLETIDRNARRLAAIVEDLLQISRLESAGQLVKPAALDLGALIEKVREAFQPLAARKRQELSIEGASRGAVVQADPDLVERAVANLVDNAIKYTPEGGRVRLRVEDSAEAAHVVVEDTGVGIPEADLPRIFERFYRVDKSRSRDLGGTGLGLAIVKHIAQLHGGSVSVRSAAGTGSTFTLRLPKSGP